MKTTAIILAAGRGRRLEALTTNTTKALVEVCDKKLIEYTLDFVKECGATDILILGRYFFKDLESTVKAYMQDVKTLQLPEPDYQTLSDVRSGLQHIIDGNVFICNADYIKMKHTAKVIKNKSTDITVFASYDLTGDDDDVMRVRVSKEDLLIDVSKKLTEYNGIYTGDFFCSEKYLPALRNAVKMGLANNSRDKAVTEHSFMELVKAGEPLRVVDVGKADWFEIDTPKELEQAERALCKK